jgi:hypothetical protein
LGAISAAYDDPALFTSPEASAALDQAVMSSLGDRAMWDAVAAFEEESGCHYDPERRLLVEQLVRIIDAISAGNVGPAIE